ncbi:MAG: glycerate kinase [Tissierellia bacterium]|nr:glycerate kinase [Tissierellia bacterium]
MKFLLAPDSFKESLTAKEAAEAMERGLRKVFPKAEFVKVPMADGGEGTTTSLVDATGGEMYYPLVLDPLGREVKAKLGILGGGDVAVIEMASASGLELLEKDERNPLVTTTYGTGQLIKEALDKGVKTIIVGIGGSATNDGGAGMVQALGGRLLDKDGKEIGFGGGALKDLAKIDLSQLDPRIKEVDIEVACDVNNPLTGELGASHIFGPQKGATPEMVLELDEALKHYAEIIRSDLKLDIERVPGAGAAGGLGAGIMAFLGGKLSPGIDIVIKYTQIEDKMEGVDYVFTGEGSIDSQTRFGKTPYGVAKVAKKFNLPVIALAGSLGHDVEVLYDYGFDAFFSILPGVCDLERALKEGAKNIERTCENIARLIKITRYILEQS